MGSLCAEHGFGCQRGFSGPSLGEVCPAEGAEQQKRTNKSVPCVQGDTNPGLFNPRKWARGQRRGRGSPPGPCCSSGSQSRNGGGSLGGWSRVGLGVGSRRSPFSGAVSRDPAFAPGTSEAAAGLWPVCVSGMICSNRSRSRFVLYPQLLCICRSRCWSRYKHHKTPVPQPGSKAGNSTA